VNTAIDPLNGRNAMTWTTAQRAQEIRDLKAAAARFDEAAADARRTAADPTAHPEERALAVRLDAAHRTSAADTRATAHALGQGADPADVGYRA